MPHRSTRSPYVSARLKHRPLPAPQITQVDGADGVDMLLRFRVEESGIGCDDTSVALSGETYAGELITGTDAIDASQCDETGCHSY